MSKGNSVIVRGAQESTEGGGFGEECAPVLHRGLE